MQLIELQIEDFRQYRSARIRFDSGITAIIGANGAGKTTLVEAVVWALYGADAKRGDNSTLYPIWTSGNARPRVTLTFELGGNRYVVSRTLNSANFFLQKDGQRRTLAVGIVPTARKSEELLGMNLRQFQTSFCARQKELEFMAYEKDKRREEISRMLGYERLSAGIVEAKAEAASLRREVEGLETGLGDSSQLQRDIEVAQQQIEYSKKQLRLAIDAERTAHLALQTIQPLKQAAEASRQTYQTLERQRISLSARMENLEEQRRQVNQKIAEMRQALARFKEIKPYVDAYLQACARRKELDRLAVYEQKRVQLQTQAESHRNAIAQVELHLKEMALKEERLNELAPSVQTHEQLQARLQTLRGYARAAQKRAQIETTIQERKQQKLMLREQIQSLGSPHQQLAKLQSQMMEKQRNLAKLEQLWTMEREAWNHRKADLNAQLRNLQVEIKGLQQKLDDLRLLGEEGECPTCKQPLGGTFWQVVQQQEDAVNEKQAQVSRLQSELDTLAAEPQEIVTLQAAVAQKQQEIKTLEQQAAELNMLSKQADEKQAQVKSLQNQLEELEAQLTALPQYDPQEEVRLNEKIKEIQPDVTEAHALQVELKRKAGIETELKQHQEAVSKIEKQIRDLPAGYDPMEHEQVRRLVDSNSAYYEESLSIKAILKEKDAVFERKKVLQTELQQTLDELQETNQTLDDLKYSEAEYLRLIEDYNAAYAKHSDAQAARATKEAELKFYQEGLKNLQAQLDEYREREKMLREKKRELILREALVDTLQEFRIELNTQLRPTLAAHAGEFLSQITDGRYSQLDIDEQYNFTLLDDGARKTVISGGESDLVNLCLRLALARLITERAGLPLSLLILDEVFVSLDAERRQNVLDVLRGLRTWFSQILVISHIEEINEAADRCLWVRRDEQTRCSIVREAQDEDEISPQALIEAETEDIQGELFVNI